MFQLYDSARWPNQLDFGAEGGLGSTKGLTRISPEELARRHGLVRAALAEADCDLLLVQSHFFPTVMAVDVHTTWLAGSNGYRNCVTLILPREGELRVVHGRKPSSNPGWLSPYLQGEDMAPYIKNARRIAYANTGYMGWQFREYLLEQCPGAEIVDFTNRLEHMIAVKSGEEIALIEDACMIQNHCWQAAATVVRPHRLLTEIRADFHHMMLNLGMDPSQMPKIMLAAQPNRPPRPGENAMASMGRRDYILQPDEYLRITFETPGSGGYYAERARCFFFRQPHPAIQAAYDEALALHEYQMSLYRPGVTMGELRERLNAWKTQRGYAPERPIEECGPQDDFTPEIRGMGLLTVDRPQIQLDWEDLVLEPGVVFCHMPAVERDGVRMSVYDMAVVTRTGARNPCPYPLELAVL